MQAKFMNVYDNIRGSKNEGIATFFVEIVLLELEFKRHILCWIL